MGFLDPMSAIVGAAIGVPVLFILYLLKLRRRPVRVSSTMLWKAAAEDAQANVPLRWLRASWLLLLHAVILGLLVAALGRPTLSGAASVRSRVVLLIDRSASMSCVDGPEGATRLDQARERAAELADRATGSGAAVCVVSFAARPIVEIPFTTSLGAVRSAIDHVTPTDQPADLAGALRVVESLLADQGEERSDARPAVCVVSDGSFTSDDSPSLTGASVSYIPVGTTGPDNAGIVAISAARDYQDPGTVRVFTRFAGSASRQVDLPVALRLDGQVVERRVVRLIPRPPAEAQSAPASPSPPAEATATFELRSASGGAAVVTIDRSDSLGCDDSASMVLPPARRAAITLVRGPEDPQRTLVVPPELLHDALSELDAASFRVINQDEFERMVVSGSLAGSDLYIFDRVIPRILPPAPTLSFGAGLPRPGLEFDPAPAAGEGEFILAWNRTHPVLRDVALDQVWIAPSMRRRATPTGPTSGILELATGPHGPLILQSSDGAFRRLVVAFDIAASNWPLQTSFPVFLASAVDYLTLRGEESAGRAFTTAENLELTAPAGAGTLTLRRLPSPGQEEAGPTPDVATPPLRVAIPAERAGQSIGVGLVERAGLYSVEPAGGQPLVAVNVVNATETACTVATGLKLGGATVSPDAAGDVPREIWLWFVIAAGALLIIEWAAFARAARA